MPACRLIAIDDKEKLFSFLFAVFLNISAYPVQAQQTHGNCSPIIVNAKIAAPVSFICGFPAADRARIIGELDQLKRQQGVTNQNIVRIIAMINKSKPQTFDPPAKHRAASQLASVLQKNIAAKSGGRSAEASVRVWNDGFEVDPVMGVILMGNPGAPGVGGF
ncbi:MAG TPA: hypothetical protein VF463_18720 [Sphingobium sp.]